MIWECLLDAFLDSLKILPILFLVYLLVEYFSHHKGNGYKKFLKLTQKAGPFVGSTLGIFPQCGFSAVMADLYSKKVITVGTLIAVFIATSDEAIPIMIANPDFIPQLLVLLLIKFVFALIFGYIIDLLFKLLKKNKINANCAVTVIEQEVEHEHKDCCDHHEHNEHCENDCCADNIFLSALKHCLNIVAFLFIATFIINIIVESAGVENLSRFFSGNIYLQSIIAGVVGLIPNCASSVFLVEFYMAGGLSFGALVAGLSVGAGIGYLVLFRKNKKILSNLSIIAVTYVLGVICGLIVDLLKIFA